MVSLPMSLELQGYTLMPSFCLYNKYLLVSFFSLFPLFESRRRRRIVVRVISAKTDSAIFSCILLILFDEHTCRSNPGMCLGRNAHTQIYREKQSVYVRSCTIRLTAQQKHTEPLFPCNWI